MKGKYGCYQITEIVVCGASLRGLPTQWMPREEEVSESFDVTLFVTMLNGIPGTAEVNDVLFSEQSALGAQLLDLCRRLKERKRGVVCLTGRAERWRLPPVGTTSPAKLSWFVALKASLASMGMLTLSR